MRHSKQIEIQNKIEMPSVNIQHFNISFGHKKTYKLGLTKLTLWGQDKMSDIFKLIYFFRVLYFDLNFCKDCFKGSNWQ